MRKTMAIFAALLTSLSFVGALLAEEWGDLTVTYVFSGPAPKTPAAKVTSDKPFCGKFHVVDESLLVNLDNRGIANVIVTLYAGRGAPKPPVHKSYAESETAEIELDNEHCRFAPHVVVLRTTQTLVLSNSDTIAHNTNLTPLTNLAVNRLIPFGDKFKLQFTLEERYPVPVACNMHPWMKAWLVVKEHPYVGVSDENGRVEIKNLPAGEWTFQAWHEKVGNVREVSVGGQEVDRGGRFTLTVKPGKNDLGEIKIPASLFE